MKRRSLFMLLLAPLLNWFKPKQLQAWQYSAKDTAYTDFGAPIKALQVFEGKLYVATETDTYELKEESDE